MSADELDTACEVMHDAYEAAAVGAGWQTQTASRKPWAEVPEANKATMRAAVTALIAHLDSAARAAGRVQPAPAAEVCPDCRYERPPHTGPGTSVPMPGMAHSRDCPTLAWMEGTPEQREKLRSDLAAITEAQRQGWRDSHNIVIGSAAGSTDGAGTADAGGST